MNRTISHKSGPGRWPAGDLDRGRRTEKADLVAEKDKAFWDKVAKDVERTQWKQRLSHAKTADERRLLIACRKAEVEENRAWKRYLSQMYRKTAKWNDPVDKRRQKRLEDRWNEAKETSRRLRLTYDVELLGMSLDPK